jgi:transcriptional regulator with XRE-family HTH domain
VSDILAVLGRNVKSYRARLEWTQEDLARQAGINRSYLAGIESGRRNTSARTIEKLARALGVSPADLLEATDVPQNE